MTPALMTQLQKWRSLHALLPTACRCQGDRAAAAAAGGAAFSGRRPGAGCGRRGWAGRGTLSASRAQQKCILYLNGAVATNQTPSGC